MPGTNLTRAEAQLRRSLITVDSYDVDLDLTRGPAVFGSSTRVRFAAHAASATFVDALADRITAIRLNGVALDPATVFDGSRIALAGLRDDNELVVDAEFAYTNTGEGLHRFVDPVDGEVYLYTQFAVPDSRRVFAVFEQPDLKATFRFTVTAKADWQVVATQATPERGPGSTPGTSVWAFEPTPRLASYATAIIAGPYAVTRSSLTSSDGRVIPLGVFIRRSLAEFQDADEFFDVTRRGFAFYEQKFSHPYPFDKYDQLFVPEMNFGAMENAGAVTFNEAMVFRGTVSQAQREQRAVTILHELAHMWFGDLVTMTWWNDLWLNESFADWASAVAASEATAWTSAWTSFLTARKSWAYQQDQLPSTHPVTTDIADLDDVQSNIDGITYAKGASVIKQLVAWAGPPAFDAAVAAYFAKHAFGSTELRDLVDELESSSGRDLGEWSQKWLATTGVNTLRPVLDTDGEGVITSFAIEQSADPAHPTLRPHRLAIGLYDEGDEGLVRVRRVEVDVDGPSTPVPALVGLRRPALVLVNDDDLTYAKVRLDGPSLETAAARLSSIADPLARALVWGALWDAARDAELPPSRFVSIALDHLGAETESAVLRVTLAQVLRAARTYVAPSRRAATVEAVGDALWRLARTQGAGSDGQFQFVNAFAEIASTPAHADVLRALLDGTETLPGRPVDVTLRWRLLTGLALAGAAGEAEIAAQLAADPTATGEEAAAEARAAVPSAAAKRAALTSVAGSAGTSNGIVRAAARGFGRVNDPAILRPVVGDYLDAVAAVWKSRGFHVGQAFAEGFFPLAAVDDALVDACREWLAAHDGPASLRRVIVEGLDGAERALRAQAADSAS